ncbi:MAG: alpha/beta hydrolase [Novosphingobium sp.]|nr:alpha/beta hydrolase [Novosphingobium sp.]
MARIELSGIGIEYELIGEEGTPAIAITPGGRMSMQTPGIRELGESIAKGGNRALLWDRPNCGASDFCFEGESESAMHGATLTELIRALDLGPTAIAGGSAGSRTTLFAAAHDPEIVSHLIQWWVSAGTISLMSLGNAYFCEPAIAASLGGMEAVAQLPAFEEQLASNANGRKTLLAQDPAQFIATMTRWADAFNPPAGVLVPGLGPDNFARISMPVLIYTSSPKDIFHPDWTSVKLHELIPHSELIDPPWSEEEFLAHWVESTRTMAGHLTIWPRLAPSILEFVAR